MSQRRGAKRPRRKSSAEGDLGSAVMGNDDDKGDPACCVSAQGDAPTIDIGSRSLLESMIHPVSKDTFARDIFRKKALYVSSEGSDRIGPIVDSLEGLDPSYILNETSSDSAFVWIQSRSGDNNNGGDGGGGGGRIHSMEMADTEQAILLHRAGHATYCRAPPSVEQPMVANMLWGTGMGCGQYDPTGNSSTCLGRGEVEVFMMSSSDHTTQWHYDFQENFTIQLSGTKRWTLQQSLVRHPLRACTPHYASPETVESQLKAAHLGQQPTKDQRLVFGYPQTNVNARGPTQRVTLTPGDVLYFPAGMWHRVETMEPGVSINVSLMGTNYATVACQALQHLLLQNNAWRQTIVGGHQAVDPLQTLHQLLKELPLIVTQFTQNGGAQAILPPVLRNPPQFVNTSDKDEGDDDDDDDEVSDDDNEEEEEAMKDNDDNGGVTMQSIEERFGARVVDVSTFAPPSGWGSAPPKNARILLNPLASVQSLDSITKFYNPDQEHKDLYLLNINYGGNELHESSVRIIVRDKLSPLNLGLDNNNNKSHGDDNEDRLRFYLFHGLYVWSNDSP